VDGGTPFTLNISAAKSIFYQQTNNTEYVNSLDKRGDISIPDSLKTKILPNWSLAREYFDQNKNQYVVEVPLVVLPFSIIVYKDSLITLSSQSNNPSQNFKKNLIFVQDTNGTIGMCIANLSPKINQDGSTNSNNSTYEYLNDFKGLLYFTDLKDSVLQGYKFDDDGWVELLNQSSSKTTSSVEQRFSMICFSDFELRCIPIMAFDSKNPEKRGGEEECKWVRVGETCFLVGGPFGGGGGGGTGGSGGANGGTFGFNPNRNPILGGSGGTGTTGDMTKIIADIKTNFQTYLTGIHITAGNIDEIYAYVDPGCITSGGSSESCFKDGFEAYKYQIIQNQLKPILGLNLVEIDFLDNNINLAIILSDFLNNDINVDPVSLLQLNEINPASIYTCKMALKSAQLGLISQELNGTNFNAISTILPQAAKDKLSANPILVKIFFNLSCAKLKLNHPEWSADRIYIEALVEVVHVGLDILGLIPVFGEVCDLTNGGIYALQGDGVNASFSFVAAAPLLGWASTGSKYAFKVLNLSHTKTTLNWIQDGTKIVFGASDNALRSQARRILKLTKGDGKIAHHILPLGLKDLPIVQKAAKAAGEPFHMNQYYTDANKARNLFAIDASRHTGGHEAYSRKIEDYLTRYFNSNSSMTSEQARDFMNNFIKMMENKLKNSTGDINNLQIP